MRILILLTVALVPATTHAQTVQGLVTAVLGLMQPLTLIAGSLVLIAFFWGLAKFISAADNEQARVEGRQVMLWGVVGMFVMVSIFGIARFLQKNLEIEESSKTPLQIPTIQYGSEE